jgi:putative DNA methylase
MHKALIEEGSFELIKLFHRVGEEARREKKAIPPTSEILYWWTRKPLIVARAILLSSTLQDLDIFKLFLKLNQDKCSFNYSVDLKKYANSLGRNPYEISFADPFSGAGNLIFEAKRLGLNCRASDYNPVAYLITKAILEYPDKYGSKLVDDLTYYGKNLIELTRKEIGKFFLSNGKKILTYIWVWCIRCPFCNQRMPLTNNMWLVNSEKRKIGFKIEANDDLNFTCLIERKMSSKDGNLFTQKGGKAICIRCRNSINHKHIIEEISKNRDREMIAVVYKDISGKNYDLPSKEDKENYINSTKLLKQLWNSYEEQGLIPNELIKANRGGDLSKYGIKSWGLFFSERQLLVMLTILKNIKLISKDIDDKEYSKVITTYLALFLCKHVNFNSIGVGWASSAQNLSHALSFRVPRIMFNHAEPNPFEKTSGALTGMLESLINGIRFASSITNNNKNICDIRLSSVLNLSNDSKNKYDLIITDPPYMDDVPYAEVSDFFYVWLYRALKEFYPE